MGLTIACLQSQNGRFDTKVRSLSLTQKLEVGTKWAMDVSDSGTTLSVLAASLLREFGPLGYRELIRPGDRGVHFSRILKL